MDVNNFLIFTVAGLQCALRMTQIERVVRVVEIKPLPQSPSYLLGVINVYGTMVPVSDLHQFFVHIPRELSISDHIIIVKQSDKLLGFLVENVHGFSERSESELTTLEKILPSTSHHSHLATFRDGVYLIEDFNTFFPKDQTEVMTFERP